MAALEGADESAAVAGLAPAETGAGRPPARRRYRDALRHRDMRLLVAALLVDQIGNWSCFVAEVASARAGCVLLYRLTVYRMPK